MVSLHTLRDKVIEAAMAYERLYDQWWHSGVDPGDELGQAKRAADKELRRLTRQYARRLMAANPSLTPEK